MPNDTMIQKNSSLGFDGGWRGVFLKNVPANIEWLPPTCGGVLHLMTRLCSCARLGRDTFRESVQAANSYTTEKRGFILRKHRKIIAVVYHGIIDVTEPMHWVADTCREGSLLHRGCPAYQSAPYAGARLYD